MAASSAQAGAEGSKPAVEERSPWFVAIVGVLTLGIYFAYWLWETSKEADRFDEYGASPYAVTKWAIPTAVVGAIGTLALGTFLVITAIGQIPENPTAEQMQEISQAMMAFAIPYIVFGLVFLVGVIATIVAQWRLWKFTERHEQAAGVEDPLTPGLLLALLVGGYFSTIIPLVGFALFALAAGYVLYRTQSGLNTIGQAARRGYQPDQAYPTLSPSAEPAGEANEATTFEPRDTG